MSVTANAVQKTDLPNGGFTAHLDIGDLALISAAKAGDHYAFEELYRRHSKKLARCIRRIVPDQTEAEDILQDTLLRAFTHLKSFEGRSSVSTWLTRIAINAAFSSLRKKRRGTVSLDDTGEECRADQIGALQDHTPDPEWQLIETEKKQLLENGILSLPPRLRDIVELRIKLGYSGKQIAKKLAISESAAKSRLCRAQLRLRSSEGFGTLRRAEA